ncbi:MAG: chromosome segregation protein SMC [Pirellulaceae bacterium]|jgi:chromosome segregation protein|nr:chromosome segregation protein SMC [Pirellulaceae bacterium]
MLKALELAGFKSFADKTRFEFPEGITVIVGPNGSGKSNIVDAIKWVLGEQSAKSLRGKDMADVIFKGSATSGRKTTNTAEATIVLENADGRIEVDAPEVHVTRRVYRSGEGEYLINGEPCRLKDIKNLFRGTGVGADAYSMIEQGKVDKLLQASARDRRAIFEEAAGISRFKAKKIEAQRRLERVEQNLLRLTDIVDEVESRLRSVRSQAVKARRYREYSDRLQQLRTHVGRTDWRNLSDRLHQIEADLTTWNDQSDRAGAEMESQEARLLELETDVTRVGESIRHAENRLAHVRAQIATHTSTIDHQLIQLRDLEEEQSRRRNQLAAMTGRAGDLHGQLQATSELLGSAESEHRRIVARLRQCESDRVKASAELDEMRGAIETHRGEYLESMRQSTQLSNRASSLESALQGLADAIDKNNTRLAELTRQRQSAYRESEAAQANQEAYEQQLSGIEAQLEKLETRLKDDRLLAARRQEEMAVVRGQITGVNQRIEVLEDLERKLEGLGDGVRELLQRSRAGEEPFTDVAGIVADLIESTVELAPLVDVALGSLAHHVVLSDRSIIDRVERRELALAGSVGFLPTPTPPLPREWDRVDYQNHKGVIGRADRLVQFDQQHAATMRWILGRVWFVHDLEHALALARSAPRGLQFVTENLEMIEAHGPLTLGPRQVASGLVSRRSELKSLRQERLVLEQRLSDATSELSTLQENIRRRDEQLAKHQLERESTVDLLAEARAVAKGMAERCDHIEQQCEVVAGETRGAEARRAAAAAELDETKGRLQSLNSESAAAEEAVRAGEQTVENLTQSHQRHAHDATLAKVEQAKSEQRVDSLRAQVTRFEEDHRERERSIDEARSLLNMSRQRKLEAERTILAATSEVAELYVTKEQLAASIVTETRQRESFSGERTTLSDAVHSLRRKIKKIQDKQHQLELDAGEVRHQRQALAERLQDDYAIDVSQLEQGDGDGENQERDEIEEEINTLRRKINSIGAVNMEALNELDDLETRYASISSQHKDLVDSKEALERIIHKINADSRRLFSETLEAIRSNFQTLYRKAFGGGKADLLLEEGVDILEAGIEIIATPPGKASFNNSLLSGGEKALTAVALLLAIFQFRPSPFCILDEVDAPFDEANIGRFVDVLKEFLGWTRFVIVTHSKKTMTAATTLYGVTMQESGVSKQVSVKFDDVSDDGQIREEAVARDQVGNPDQGGADDSQGDAA